MERVEQVEKRAIWVSAVLLILLCAYLVATSGAQVLAAGRRGEAGRDPALGVSSPPAVTHGPARAAGLSDRGRLEPGARADLLAVGRRAGLPAVGRTWVAGREV